MDGRLDKGNKMPKKFNRSKFTDKNGKFNPKRPFIKKEVDKYLKKGGKITRIEFNKKLYDNFINVPNEGSAVNDFLNGF